MGFQESVAAAADIATQLAAWINENMPDLIGEHPELLEKVLGTDSVYRSDYVADQVIANLLSAHRRVSCTGSVSDLIELSKYLLEVSKEERDILMHIVPEE